AAAADRGRRRRRTRRRRDRARRARGRHRALSGPTGPARRHPPFIRRGQTASMDDDRRMPQPEATANSGAVGVIGLELRGETPAPRKQVFSWALWDWATQPFNTVILTFIFTALYLTTDAFLPADLQGLDAADPVKEAAIAELTSGL